MLLTIALTVVSIVSLAIAFFLTDRSHWRKSLLIVGMLGVALSSIQAWNNRQRAAGLQNDLGMLQQKQEYWDVSRLNALGLNGLAAPPLIEHTAIGDLIAPHVKLQPKFWMDCRPDAMTAYGSVIAMNDRFPFAYYYRGMCAHANGTDGWQKDLEKAKSILEITTKVPGHNPNHDEVLKLIRTDNLIAQ